MKQIPSQHRIVISHPKSLSEPRNDSLLSSLLFPDNTVTSRQLTAFTLSRTMSSIPEQDRPRKPVFKTESCPLSQRQKIIYDDLLHKSKGGWKFEISVITVECVYKISY